MRSPSRTSLLAPRGGRAQRTVTFLPDEPAGKIATRTAGAIEFGATLTWRSLKDVPPEPIFLEHGAAARCFITVTDDPEATARRLAGQIRAFTRVELASALEAALRTVTTVAALTDAMLEVGAVRTLQPGVASPRALEELARDLWGAGFRVRFGSSWTPAPGADVCVGIGGDLQEFLRAHPSWSVA